MARLCPLSDAMVPLLAQILRLDLGKPITAVRSPNDRSGTGPARWPAPTPLIITTRGPGLQSGAKSQKGKGRRAPPGRTNGSQGCPFQPVLPRSVGRVGRRAACPGSHGSRLFASKLHGSRLFASKLHVALVGRAVIVSLHQEFHGLMEIWLVGVQGHANLVRSRN